MFDEDDDNEGVLSRRSDVNRREKDRVGGMGALVRRESGQAIAKTTAKVQAGLSKLSNMVANSADIASDAQRIAIILASYGEGDRMGMYAFDGRELIGEAGREVTIQGDMSIDPVTKNATYNDRVEKTEDFSNSEHKLDGITVERLRNAVGFLVDHGWARTTADRGTFAKGLDWDEVVLTTEGRASVQQFVKRAADHGGFEGLPPLFDFAGAPALPAPASTDTELQSFQKMLSRARVKHAVDPNDADDTTQVFLNRLHVVFTFDSEGKLEGVAEEKDSDS